MSNRETGLKSFSLTEVGGINQRVYVTELSPEEYSNLVGLFPEFTGLQSRLFGKRLLKKYANPIYGIYQAWTPYGYGIGLYQFTGEIDFGYWLTPTSNFDLSIPPLGIDLGGMTLDDFGNPYNSNFDYGPQNACVVSFLTNNTDHSSCAPAPSNVGTPNDTNGGPAGQGKKCSNEEVVDDYDLADFTSLQVSGSLHLVQPIVDVDNCRNPADGFNPPCVNFPALPQVLGSAPGVTYASVTITGVLAASQVLTSFAAFVPATNPTCTFRTSTNQESTVSSNKLTINLSPLLISGYESVNLVLTRTPGGAVEIPLTVSEDDQVLNANDYLVLGVATPNASNGFDQSGSVTGNTIRVRRRARVCV